MAVMVEGSGDGLGLSLQDGLPSMAQLLQPAQDKLRQQLLATRQRLEEELRERRYAIKVRLPCKTFSSISRRTMLRNRLHLHPSKCCRRRKSVDSTLEWSCMATNSNWHKSRLVLSKAGAKYWSSQHGGKMRSPSQQR